MIRALWFSPLPPARTDIANYTNRILPHISKLMNVQLVHPDGSEPSSETGAIPSSALSATAMNLADICIYQLGNNAEYHADIFKCAVRHPGIIVLHDRAINECVLGIYLQDEQRGGASAANRYRETMFRWYGRPGAQMASAVLNGRHTARSIASDYPLYEEALHGALGAVCHNPLVTQELRARFPKLPVLSLPLPYPNPPDVVPTSTTRTDEPIRLVMFGFMAENRRLLEFLSAWASSPHRDRFELELAGALDDEQEISLTAQRLNLGSQVHFRGFLEEQALDKLIAAADLVLNLRNPTMGEASGSQLRIWFNRTASAVSDSGWYGLLPNDCAYKIGIDSEREDLSRLLEGMANSSIDLAKMATCGVEKLAEHDPPSYARSLVDWLQNSVERMATNWTETKLLYSVANAYADALPQTMAPSLPPNLLGLASADASDML